MGTGCACVEERERSGDSCMFSMLLNVDVHNLMHIYI